MPRRKRDYFKDAIALKYSADLTGVADNTVVVVGQPLSAALVPPSNYLLVTSSATEFQGKVVNPVAVTSKRLVALSNIPGISYATPGTTAPPYLGTIVIDTVNNAAFFAADVAASTDSWIAVTGAGAGTGA